MEIGGPNAVEASLAAAAASEQGGAVHRVLLEEGAGRRAEALASRARALGIPVSAMGRGECDRLVGVRCQGIAADISYGYGELGDLLAAPSGLVVFLDEIADPHNLGALIRTAEAAGALGVVVPARRAAAVNATVMRISAGAAVYLPVCRVSNLARALQEARDAGFWLFGLDHRASGCLASGYSGAGREKMGLVVGSEGQGLRRLVAEACDELVRLPMRGRVDSLNASVAGALAIYRVLDNSLPDVGE